MPGITTVKATVPSASFTSKTGYSALPARITPARASPLRVKLNVDSLGGEAVAPMGALCLAVQEPRRSLPGAAARNRPGVKITALKTNAAWRLRNSFPKFALEWACLRGHALTFALEN